MKKVLITGVNGFVAQRFINHLKGNGSVQVESTTARKDHVAKAVHYLDLKEIEDADFAFLEHIDVVFHFASMNEVECVKHLKDALLINGYASLKLYEAAVARGVKRFVYLSTAHVFGPQVGSISVDSKPNPLHPYSISKYLGEQLIRSSKADLDYAILRLSNSFGYPIQKETSRWKLLVNDLCKQAIQNQQIQLNSSGKQYRNFIPLSDLLPLFEHFIHSDEVEWNKTYNVSGFDTTILAMAHKISEIASQFLNQTITVKIKETSQQEANPDELNYLGSEFAGFGKLAVDIDSDSTKQEVVGCLKQVIKFHL